ncbi:hypothetical protein L4174_023205 [Photobacterium sp. CCB-ST2H9]|uniref:hypothetical protein n=1 Tax=Photobacterium sp. CCB-ST2H9 TaxID=2912855 RepID=UPI0020059D84|nr:hypothetical protein [Photobacterium sp. CCB-ST2H9]UTM59604.1 hypothetical protein L4174_023205 [Photobacterium sp. CCB-ST2H9]
MNKNEAIRATKNGAIAALISAFISLVVILIAINTNAEGKLAIMNDPANFFDVGLILVFALGVYKKSRIASVLVLVHFIVSKLIISIETQSVNGLWISFVFLYFYGKAIKGAFVYHKLDKENNPDYKETPKWIYVISIPSVVVFILILGFVLMSTFGFIPSTRVQSNQEISKNDISILRQNGIVNDDDKVEFFYSQGFLSIMESGNVLTQDRVILYLTDENESVLVYEIPLSEITSVEMELQGDIFTESIYKVNTEDPDHWIKLFLSVEQNGDQKFINALQDRLGR